MCQKLNKCSSVEEAEAEATLIGLKELAKLYRGVVTLEIDCATVGKELHCKGQNRAKYFSLVADINQAMSAFATHCVMVVRRTCNALAHELAATARSARDQIIVATVQNIDVS